MNALPEMLRGSLWARALTAEELTRVEGAVVERAVPAGGHVCHKGDPVEHWIGIIGIRVLDLPRLRNFGG
jgi:hypothetical protein